MTTEARWLGLDIGGANLKAAATDGYALHVPFALWERPDELCSAIESLVRHSPTKQGLAVTMTGELADCFATKADGVAAIVQATEQAARGRETRYYSLNHGGFLKAHEAVEDWRGLAAANWHALTTYVARVCKGAGWLIDVGSTTTDVIPFANGVPSTDAKTDTDRLLASQLLYMGVGRTPVCAVVDHLPYRGSLCPVAAELFATTGDAALVAGYEQVAERIETADGRPADLAHATARLARMICQDAASFDLEAARVASLYILDAMQERLRVALQQALQGSTTNHPCLVLSGSGAWLAERVISELDLGSNVLSLASLIGTQPSYCAPAYAVASLCERESGKK